MGEVRRRAAGRLTLHQDVQSAAIRGGEHDLDHSSGFHVVRSGCGGAGERDEHRRLF